MMDKGRDAEEREELDRQLKAILENASPTLLRYAVWAAEQQVARVAATPSPMQTSASTPRPVSDTRQSEEPK